MQQILQRNQQQGVDFSAMLGNTGVGGGGAIDFASLLNNAGSTPDYSAFLNAAAAGGGASGIDYSSILGGAAGGGNVDIAAFLAAQNKLGGLAGVIGNLGGAGSWVIHSDAIEPSLQPSPLSIQAVSHSVSAIESHLIASLFDTNWTTWGYFRAQQHTTPFQFLNVRSCFQGS
ncbi:hypothetical protein Mp_4g03140 [Marchantia polymorpha subsp. ruderalis]|uniref:Uncharacterized protein n=2 Tax=Marchantia polymorpha TaxID=3197 RepID=A0AAF6B5S5_MARPO|nr:hypothetical protein MARPO_0172s0007 [Marchantia polymorpha]BBN07359.1 hypothetical protein Mp_4g03140 [Marchantia polymorpha subsp. ruderalis]|eukprot:PTQ28135.1 hypothetical protein MARPO_0172s0007 [Marchantia polymorpha]